MVIPKSIGTRADCVVWRMAAHALRRSVSGDVNLPLLVRWIVCVMARSLSIWTNYQISARLSTANSDLFCADTSRYMPTLILCVRIART